MDEGREGGMRELVWPFCVGLGREYMGEMGLDDRRGKGIRSSNGRGKVKDRISVKSAKISWKGRAKEEGKKRGFQMLLLSPPEGMNSGIAPLLLCLRGNAINGLCLLEGRGKNGSIRLCCGLEWENGKEGGMTRCIFMAFYGWWPRPNNSLNQNNEKCGTNGNKWKGKVDKCMYNNIYFWGIKRRRREGG